MDGEHCLWMDSPIGRLRLTATTDALTGIEFRARKPPARRAEIPPAAAALLRAGRRQLEAYFARELEDFDLPLAPQGTPFQRATWQKLREIPYGATITYGDLARKVGRPKASRAVGAANGRNPLPIVIPCHRVIGSDGSLTGFGGGIKIKRQLLELEGALAPQSGDLGL